MFSLPAKLMTARQLAIHKQLYKNFLLIKQAALLLASILINAAIKG
jgi:hypothetical protein